MGGEADLHAGVQTLEAELLVVKPGAGLQGGGGRGRQPEAQLRGGGELPRPRHQEHRGAELGRGDPTLSAANHQPVASGRMCLHFV